VHTMDAERRPDTPTVLPHLDNHTNSSPFWVVGVLGQPHTPPPFAGNTRSVQPRRLWGELGSALFLERF